MGSPSVFSGTPTSQVLSRILEQQRRPPDNVASAPAASIEPFPPEWKYRDAVVPWQAASLRVPKYILRIDIVRGGSVTSGWQVRYPYKSSTKLFSDSMFDRKGHLGTPAESLHEAMRHLRSIWQGPPSLLLRTESPRKKYPTGMTGVRVAWTKSKATRQCHVRIDDLSGKPIASLYAGTEATFDSANLELLIAQGRRIRLKYLKEQGMLDRLPPVPSD